MRGDVSIGGEGRVVGVSKVLLLGQLHHAINKYQLNTSSGVWVILLFLLHWVFVAYIPVEESTTVCKLFHLHSQWNILTVWLQAPSQREVSG